jgi:peptidoglycan/LPS O-acetylase OafA/YrhL
VRKKGKDIIMLAPAHKKHNAVNVDFLEIGKGIAILAVIAWHVTSPFLQQSRYQGEVGGDLDSSFTWIAIFVRHLLGFGVPYFFVLSGYSLSRRYRELDFSLSSFYRRRLLRIYLPFLAWLPLYLVMLGDTEWRSVIIHLVFLGGSYHFWFLWVLVCCYVLFPIILYSQKPHVSVTQSCHSRSRWFLLLSLLFVASILSWLVQPVQITSSWTLNFVLNEKILVIPYNLFLFACGVCIGIRREGIEQLVRDYSRYITTFVTVAIGIAAVRILLFVNPEVILFGKGVLFALDRLHGVLGVTIVVLLSYITMTRESYLGQALKSLGRSSYGIYLGHAAMLAASRGILGLVVDEQSPVYVLGTYLVTSLALFSLCIGKRTSILCFLGFGKMVGQPGLAKNLFLKPSRCRAMSQEILPSADHKAAREVSLAVRSLD